MHTHVRPHTHTLTPIIISTHTHTHIHTHTHTHTLLFFTKPAATDSTDDTDVNNTAFVQDQDIDSDFTGQSQHAYTETDDGLVAKIKEYVEKFFG